MEIQGIDERWKLVVKKENKKKIRLKKEKEREMKGKLKI